MSFCSTSRTYYIFFFSLLCFLFQFTFHILFIMSETTFNINVLGDELILIEDGYDVVDDSYRLCQIYTANLCRCNVLGATSTRWWRSTQKMIGPQPGSMLCATCNTKTACFINWFNACQWLYLQLWNDERALSVDWNFHFLISTVTDFSRGQNFLTDGYNLTSKHKLCLHLITAVL